MKKLLQLLGLAAVLLLGGQAAFAQGPTATPTPVPHEFEFSRAERQFKVTIDLTSCSDNATCRTLFPLDGCQPGDIVRVDRPTGWTAGAFIGNAVCATNNFGAIDVVNESGGSFDPASQEYTGTWKDRTNPNAIETPYFSQNTPTPTRTPTRTPTP